MQLDMFGATDTTATRNAAPPALVANTWMPPESLAFEAALRRGALTDALGVLNRLKVDAASRVLLASGFAVGSAASRASLMASAQQDILEAARRGMNGHELRVAREVPATLSVVVDAFDVAVEKVLANKLNIVEKLSPAARIFEQVLETPALSDAEVLYAQGQAVVTAARSNYDLAFALSKELPFTQALEKLKVRAQVVMDDDRVQQRKIGLMRQSQKKVDAWENQVQRYSTSMQEIDVEIATLGEMAEKLRAEQLPNLLTDSFVSQILNNKADDGGKMREAFRNVDALSRQSWDRMLELRTLQTRQVAANIAAQITADNLEEFLEPGAEAEDVKFVRFADVKLDNITIDTLESLRKFGDVSFVDGFGKNAGKRSGSATIRQTIEDNLGQVRNGVSVRVGTNGASAVEYGSVNAGWQASRDKAVLAGANREELQFLAAINQIFYRERGRGLSVNNVSGILNELHDAADSRGAANYVWALAELHGPGADKIFTGAHSYQKLMKATFEQFKRNLPELVAQTTQPAIDIPSDMETYIKIAADSIGELRKVDVFRVLESNRSDLRVAIANYIVDSRADLLQEVDAVMREEYNAMVWRTDNVLVQQTSEDLAKLREVRQLLIDNMETRRINNEGIPSAWSDRLAELDTTLGPQEMPDKAVDQPVPIDMSGWSEVRQRAHELRQELKRDGVEFMTNKIARAKFIAKVRGAAERTPLNEQDAVMMLDMIATQLEIGNVTTSKGNLKFAEPVREAITSDIAALMSRGLRVVDGQGVEYYGWGARHDYLETKPFGKDGKPEVYMGNSVTFHLKPETAGAYPERRHDPVYLVAPLQLKQGRELPISDLGRNNTEQDHSVKAQEALGNIHEKTHLVEAWQAITRPEDSFQNPKSYAKEWKDIFADHGMSIFKLEGDSLKEGKAADMFTLEIPVKSVEVSGKIKDTMATVSIYTDSTEKTSWINVGGLVEGSSAGSRIYQSVADWSHNNGYIFKGDPAGLLDPALRRRTEQMLASALKWGTTDHLMPHDRQVNPSKADCQNIGVRPIDWVPFDTAHNLREMMLTNSVNLSNIEPDSENLSYNFEDGKFYNNDKELSDEAIEILSESEGYRRAHAGVTTIKRAAFTNTFLREEREGRGRQLMDIISEFMVRRGSDISGREANATKNVSYNESSSAFVSTLDQSIFAGVQGGKSPAAILQEIAEKSDNLLHQAVAQALMGKGVTASLTVDKNIGNTFTTGKQSSDYAAAYYPATHTATLFEPANAVRNVLHELTHAATHQALKENGKASMQMHQLFNVLCKHAELQGTYGISNVDEFVAEAFSNPAFQKQLMKIEGVLEGSGVKSAWSHFVDIVRSSLGMRTGNALEEVLRAGNDLMMENDVFKLDGVKMVANGLHVGRVDDVRGGFVVQDGGRGEKVAHAVGALDRVPVVGDVVQVAYAQGLGKVSVRGQAVEKGSQGR